MTNEELEYELECFIEHVMGGYEIDKKNSDLDRIYFKDTDQFIRLWNISNTAIDYSIFEPGYGGAEEIAAGHYTLIYKY